MPAKLDRCVEALKEKGYEESRAYAICNASIDEGKECKLVADAAMANIIEKHIDEDTGFLTMNAVVSRVGIQDYYGIELGTEFEPYKVYRVFRPPEEVFAETSLDSFINCPATDEHPDEMVTVDNVGSYMKGSISTASKDGDHVTSRMTITDKDLIKKIMNGKTELSVGYTHDLEKKEGEYNEQTYDLIQKNIKANHVAVVDRGRCGQTCKLTADNDAIITGETNKGGMMKVMINGVEFDLPDEAVMAIEAEREKMKGETEEMETDMEAMKSETEELKQSNDKLQAKVDAAEAKVIKDADIQKMVSDKAAIMFKAASILGKSFDANKTVCDMKREVIAQELPNMSLDGKSSSYVDAAFDMAIDKHESAKKSLDSLSGDLSKGASSVDSVKAYDAYKNNILNAWKGDK